jgi:hypothetical protein
MDGYNLTSTFRGGGSFITTTTEPIKRGILLSIASVLGIEMKNLDGKTNSKVMTTRAVFVIVVAVAAGMLVPTIPTAIIILQSADAVSWTDPDGQPRTARSAQAPSVVTGDNVYIAWWNGTAGEPDVQTDVMFRASTDGGQTFSDRINLSNSSDADSWRVEIAGEGETVVVSWWETNQTSDIPVARISTDAGETFGPMIMLATNGTISDTEEGGAGTTTAEQGEEELLPNEEVVPTEEEA